MSKKGKTENYYVLRQIFIQSYLFWTLMDIEWPDKMTREALWKDVRLYRVWETADTYAEFLCVQYSLCQNRVEANDCFRVKVGVKRGLHGHSAVPLVCVQCSRHTHLCVSHMLPHSVQRSLRSEWISVPLLCAASTCLLFFSAILSTTAFILWPENRLYSMVVSFLNYNFSPLATEWPWDMCLGPEYRKAMPHTAL